MKNPTLRIFAVVSVIILLFGGMSVYLAVQMKNHEKEATKQAEIAQQVQEAAIKQTKIAEEQYEEAILKIKELTKELQNCK